MLAIGFAAGLVLLVLGADLLVAGASRIAARMGISPLVIGLTVVAFGTSAPELGVSLQAVYSGQGAIALGNVVGSNIFNVLFILGLSAIVTPLAVKARLIRFDVPFMVAVSIAVYCLAWDGAYGRFDGVLLFGGLTIYTAGLLLWGAAPADGVGEEQLGPTAPWWWNAGKAVVGLGLLVAGARLLVARPWKLPRG